MTAILPSTLTYLGYGTFNNCGALRSISVAGVGTVFAYTFGNCTSLKTIIVNEGVTLIEYCAFNQGVPERVVLPKSLTSLNSAFYSADLSNLKLYLLATSPSEVLWTDGPDSSVPRLYYSETAPTDTTYSYWHYVNGIPVAW